MNKSDILTKYLKWKFNNNSIEVLEEITSNYPNQILVHYMDDKSSNFYTIIKDIDVNKFETIRNRKYKINNIKKKSNDTSKQKI